MSESGQTEEECAPEEMGAPERDLYDQKAVSTVVRVLTVLAYLLSVSLAAILLSVYYVCVWRSPELPLLNDTLEVSALRAAPPHQHHSDYYPGTGTFRGSNSTVSENATQIGNLTDDSWSGNDTDRQLQLGNLSEELESPAPPAPADDAAPPARDLLNASTAT